MPLAQFEQSFIAQDPQSAQHGVGVDVHDSGQVPGGRDALAGPRLAVGDRAADLCGNLVMKQGGVIAVDRDF